MCHMVTPLCVKTSTSFCFLTYQSTLIPRLSVTNTSKTDFTTNSIRFERPLVPRTHTKHGLNLVLRSTGIEYRVRRAPTAVTSLGIVVPRRSQEAPSVVDLRKFRTTPSTSSQAEVRIRVHRRAVSRVPRRQRRLPPPRVLAVTHRLTVL